MALFVSAAPDAVIGAVCVCVRVMATVFGVAADSLQRVVVADQRHFCVQSSSEVVTIGARDVN